MLFLPSKPPHSHCQFSFHGLACTLPLNAVSLNGLNLDMRKDGRNDPTSTSLAGVLCLSLWVAPGLHAAVHVARTGADTNPGSEAAPLGTVTRAVAVINETGGPGEIVIHEGRYEEAILVRQPKLLRGMQAPPLLIRAAENAIVVFDGSELVTGAERFEGKLGVYRVQGKFPDHLPPAMWEADTRIRYTIAADAGSVARFPGSVAALSQTSAVLSTSDKRPPSSHELRYARTSKSTGCFIDRDNTTLRGLRFDNWSFSATDLRGNDGSVEDCLVVNSGRVFNAGGRNNRCLRCVGREVGSGAYSNGFNNVVENCKFFAARDAFRFPTYSQDDTGIQFYNPANGGTIRFNLCEGFLNGIFCKAVSGTFLVEHNTCVGKAGSAGFYLSDWRPGSIVRQNIFFGYLHGILSPEYLSAGGLVDENLFWNPGNPERQKETLEVLRKSGTGRANEIVEPHFAEPTTGDYRLLPGVTLGDEDGPVGALPLVSERRSARVPQPSLLVVPAPPVQPYQSSIDIHRTKAVRPDYPRYITKDRRVRLNLYRKDGIQDAFTRIRVAVDGWKATAILSTSVHELELPDKDGEHKVEVWAASRTGNWSGPAVLDITLRRSAPMLAGSLRVRASKYGAVLFIAADRPVFCSVEVQRPGSAQWAKGGDSLQIQHEWEQSLAGNVWPTDHIPSMHHVVAVAEDLDGLRAGRDKKENRYRVTLRDVVGNESVTEHAVMLQGASRIVYVAASGLDEEGRGDCDKPYATLQYALDQALPGDTVRLMPGVHLGASLFHGGVKGAPITVEAEEAGTAVLDSMKRTPVLLYLVNAPWVVVRNLELRWFLYVGVMAYRSNNVTISNCLVWNGVSSSWINGTGILLFDSPGSTVDHSVAFHVENGISAVGSPGARITHNTSSCNMYNGLALFYSSKDTTVRNNAFCFNGIAGIGIYENAETNNPEVIASLDLDYNNYAARIREGDMGDMTPKENLVLNRKGCGVSKFLIGCGHVTNLATLPPPYTPYSGRFFTLESWKGSSGKDAHSIYADPLFVNPNDGRFDVGEGSPNICAGENGTTLGAAGRFDP